jgi:hypothetical protein
LSAAPSSENRGFGTIILKSVLRRQQFLGIAQNLKITTTWERLRFGHIPDWELPE